MWRSIARSRLWSMALSLLRTATDSRPVVLQVGDEKHGAANGAARQDNPNIVAVAALLDADPRASGKRGITPHLREKTWPFVEGHIAKVGMLLAGERSDGGGMEKVSNLVGCEVLENGFVRLLVYVEGMRVAQMGCPDKMMIDILRCPPEDLTRKAGDNEQILF